MDNNEQMQQEFKDLLNLFLIEFKSRIERYYKANSSNAPLPIYWNPQFQMFCWANRKMGRDKVKKGKLKNGQSRKNHYRDGFRAN